MHEALHRLEFKLVRQYHLLYLGTINNEPYWLY